MKPNTAYIIQPKAVRCLYA